MFLLLIPALTALIAIPLSWLIPDLHFAVNWMFYVGLMVVSASLFSFSLMSWRQPSRSASLPENPSIRKTPGQVARSGQAIFSREANSGVFQQNRRIADARVREADAVDRDGDRGRAQ